MHFELVQESLRVQFIVIIELDICIMLRTFLFPSINLKWLMIWSITLAKFIILFFQSFKIANTKAK